MKDDDDIDYCVYTQLDDVGRTLTERSAVLPTGDSLRYQEGGFFSTPDQDNSCDGKCTKDWGGSWWFGPRGCHRAFLNGPYVDGGKLTTGWKGIMWPHWKGMEYSLQTTEMKLRPFDRKSESE